MAVYTTRLFVKTGANDDLYALRTSRGPEPLPEGAGQSAIGTPVPVVFGTRFVDPVISFWWPPVSTVNPKYTANIRLGLYADRDSGGGMSERRRIGTIARGQIITDLYQVAIAEKNNMIRMYFLTMRMILCVGAVDDIKSFYGGSHLFFPVKRPQQPYNWRNPPFRIPATAGNWDRESVQRYYVPNNYITLLSLIHI